MKKAKYTGPSGTGVDLHVTFADGQLRSVHVDQGHQLPTEVDGLPVPATFRDGLLDQEDWSEVSVNTDPKPSDKKTDTAPAGKETTS